VALAATTDFADGILHSNAPAVDRIGVLKDHGGATMSDAELKLLFGREEMRKAIGNQVEGDKGHFIVATEHLRLSAVATSSGEVCMTIAEWDDGSHWPTSGWHVGSAGCGAFTPGWPLMDASGARGSEGFDFSYGLTANGVKLVRFVAGDATYDATMGRNGYLWRHEPGVRPTAIQAILDDGTIVQREYPPQGVYRPPTDPHIVD
jgi:hypothetical protein